jgi:hypothetical protein
MDFAMMAGNRRVGDLKVLSSTRPMVVRSRVQFVGATCHALVLDNKFGHNYGKTIMVTADFKSNGNL